MRTLQKIPLARLIANPRNARTLFDAPAVAALAESLKAGQHVPIIVFPQGDGYCLADGEMRRRAALVAGLTELEAIVLEAAPTESELLLIQASIDTHRANFKPSERASLWHRILEERGCTVTELAGLIGVSQALASKYLAIRRLDAELLHKLDAGELDVEKAYLLASADADQRATLTGQASSMSREQLRQRIKGTSSGGQATVKSARFPMPGGLQVAVQGNDLTLCRVVELLGETLRILKKAAASGIDIDAQVRVMRSQLKASPKSATA